MAKKERKSLKYWMAKGTNEMKRRLPIIIDPANKGKMEVGYFDLSQFEFGDEKYWANQLREAMKDGKLLGTKETRSWIIKKLKKMNLRKKDHRLALKQRRKNGKNI